MASYGDRAPCGAPAGSLDTTFWSRLGLWHRRGRMPALGRPRRSASDWINPIERIAPHRGIQPVWGHSTREARFNLIESIAPDQNGLNDHRWGVSPDRQQASSRTWPPVSLPRFCRRLLSGVYLRPPYPRLCSRPRRRHFSGVYRRPPGSAAPVRVHDARGNGGGIAALGALLRRVAGVSHLYWCNSPRLVVPSTWGELDRVPLTAQVPLFGGGFAPLEASCRCVVGVSSQRLARPCLRLSMSHVIPMRLVQMLNPHRWNCNVFG